MDKPSLPRSEPKRNHGVDVPHKGVKRTREKQSYTEDSRAPGHLVDGMRWSGCSRS